MLLRVSQKSLAHLLSCFFTPNSQLGPPAIGALSHPLFWLGDSVPLLK